MKISLYYAHLLLTEEEEIADAIWEEYENIPCYWRGLNEEDL